MTKLISGHLYEEKNHRVDKFMVIRLDTRQWAYWNTGWMQSEDWYITPEEDLVDMLGKDLGSFTRILEKLREYPND